MDSNARESLDSKAEFRKPSNDAASRKYRRRSPAGGSSSSSDGSLHRDRSSSPLPLKKESTRVADDNRKTEDGRNLSGRSGESYKYTDRHSSKNYPRHDEHSRRDRHVDDYDRGYSKSSYRSNRDQRDNGNFDHSRSDKEHRSRDYVKDIDTHSHAKSDGLVNRSRDKEKYERAGSGRGDQYVKTDRRKSLGDQSDSSSRKDTSGHRLKETSWREGKELNAEKYVNDEKRKFDNRSIYKEEGSGEAKEHSDDKSIKFTETVTKKPKFSSLDSKAPVTDGTSEQPYVTDSDIDAAKIAAMKAAELVNKNLVGTGYMSTDQKKKLLWGSKKSTATEESAHRWDTITFGDRERQEKFNKLMNLRLPWYLLPIVGSKDGPCGGGAKIRQSRCREAKGAASDGFGEAIHGWIASERWSNCWTRSLNSLFRYSRHACIISQLFVIMLYCFTKLFCNMLKFLHVEIFVVIVKVAMPFQIKRAYCVLSAPFMIEYA
ncbi:hypothetical protein ACP275_10G161100 [Erythranthe tilingii]